MAKKINLSILKKAKVRFDLSAFEAKHFPISNQLEFAFIGRSNVGKSTLINSITSNRKLAKTSNTPGRTRSINFFHVENYLTLVDLPGYGYNKISLKLVKQLNLVTRDYLLLRKNLARVFLLIDSRRAIKEIDLMIMTELTHFGVPFQIIITKSDKLKGSELDLVIKQVEAQIHKFGAALPKMITSSAKNNLGIDQIKLEIMDFYNQTVGE